MEAYYASPAGQSGEQPGRQSLFLGPAWLIACGAGAILGGFFMRGTPFSWPLVMLGAGVGLVGATMLYRNVMRARRYNDAIAAATAGAAGGGGGGLPPGILSGFGAVGLPLTAAVRPPMDGAFAAAAAGGAAARSLDPSRPLSGQGPAVYVVLLEKTAPLDLSATAAGRDGTTMAAAAAGEVPSCSCSWSRNNSGGRRGGCSRCGGGGHCCGGQRGVVWRGEEAEVGPFADAIALGVRLTVPSSLVRRVRQGAAGQVVLVGGEDHNEPAAEDTNHARGGGPALVPKPDGPTTSGGPEAVEGARLEEEEEEMGEDEEQEAYGAAGDAAAVAASAPGGFALVLQPRPQLLGFSMRVVKELPPQMLPLPPLPPRQDQQLALNPPAAVQFVWQQHQQMPTAVLPGAAVGLLPVYSPVRQVRQQQQQVQLAQQQLVAQQLSPPPPDRQSDMRREDGPVAAPGPPPPPLPHRGINVEGLSRT